MGGQRAVPTELAWAAGFFDGEGTISLQTQHYKPTGWERKYIVTKISQTHLEPLERFHRAVGLGRVNGPYKQKNPKHTDYYNWQASDRESEELRELLWPYLSGPKKAQWCAKKAEKEGYDQ